MEDPAPAEVTRVDPFVEDRARTGAQAKPGHVEGGLSRQRSVPDQRGLMEPRHHARLAPQPRNHLREVPRDPTARLETENVPGEEDRACHSPRRRERMLSQSETVREGRSFFTTGYAS